MAVAALEAVAVSSLEVAWEAVAALETVALETGAALEAVLEAALARLNAT